METPIQAAPKKSNTGLIIGIVVVVLLCCCCLLVAIGGYGYSRYQAASALSGINSGLPGSTGGTGGSGGGGSTGTVTNIPGIPSGGKGDDAQRSAAYGFVVIAAATDGCSTSSPKADSTKISVSQQPDSSGAWQEEWTVVCDSGSNKTYVVAFPAGDANISEIKVSAK